MKLLYLAVFSIASLCAQAQKFTISGSIKAKNSGEHLIGASVYNVPTAQGTTANNYGFYSLRFRGIRFNCKCRL